MDGKAAEPAESSGNDAPLELSTFTVHSKVFPVLTVVCLGVATVGAYVITNQQNHFTSVLPFFSDLGSFPPERCFFTFFMNIGAFFWLCTAYFVYATLTVHIHTYMEMDFPWALSIVAFNTSGSLVGIGFSLVANFQESNVRAFHELGLATIFLFGLFYFWGFVVISLKIRPSLQSQPKPLLVIRILLASLYTLSLVARTWAELGADVMDDSAQNISKKQIRDTNRESGFTDLLIDNRRSHILKAGIEYGCFALFSLLTLTFVVELDGFDVKTIGKKIMQSELEESDVKTAILLEDEQRQSSRQ